MNSKVDNPPPLFLIGWDGATWDLLQPWMEAGHLPNLLRLVNRGVTSSVPSIPTINSGPAWTSIVTGVNPGRHGIFHLYNDPGFCERRPMHSSDRCMPAIWTRLSMKGLPVCVVNVPVTYPADPVCGVMISGIDAPSVKSPGFTYPPNLISEIGARIGRYEISPEMYTVARAGRLDTVLKLILETLERRLQTVLHLVRTRPLRFLMVVFTESDWAQHYLWPLPGRGEAVMSERLRQVFERLDLALGQLWEAAGTEATLMLLSDHGFGPGHGGIVYLIPLLAKLGYQHFHHHAKEGRRLRHQARLWAIRYLSPSMLERLKHWFPALSSRFNPKMVLPATDWATTSAYAQLERPEININLKGRQPFGTVEPEKYEGLREEIVQVLSRVIEVESKRSVFQNVWRREEVYHGPEANSGPDLILDFDDTSPTHGLRLGEITVSETYGGPFVATGGHRRNGILVATGPEIRCGAEIAGISLYDIAPTVMHLLDISVPEGLDGRVLTELLREESLAKHPVHYEPEPFPPGRTKPVRLDTEDEEAVRNRLRGLGYFE